MSDVVLAGYGYTANVKHWQHDFLLKVDSPKINGKIQFITSKQALTNESNRVILHVWRFPTWEQKKEGEKAKHSYSQNLSELVGVDFGMFRLFSTTGSLQTNSYMWDNGIVKIKGSKIVVLPDGSDVAMVTEIARLYTADSGDPIWRRARVRGA